MPIYRISSGVQPAFVKGRPTIATHQGGNVAVDSELLTLRHLADGRSLEEIVETFQAPGATPETVRAALACLAEAGLLERDGQPPATKLHPPAQGELVSVVIVSHNSQEWLSACLASLADQTYSPMEVIVVDNASRDGSADWLRDHHPEVQLIRLDELQPLARALNLGVEAASGAYFLLLNQDVHLEPDAVAQMVAVAGDDPACAAVAAKLKFSWAPAFLNGLGNSVGPFSWGTDNALGHLDLGQFDHTTEVPSACFAAALIPRVAWGRVGPIDEGFRLYYEDVDWCYRARVFGHSVCAAPQATIYHALGGRVHTGRETDLIPTKLQHVAYGRLRFACKNLSAGLLLRYLLSYAIEDIASALVGLLTLQGRRTLAYARAWGAFARHLPAIRRLRRAIQSRRASPEARLLAVQRQTVPPHIWHGLPELTWDLVLHSYAPLMLVGLSRPLPEFPPPEKASLLIVSNDVIAERMAGPGMRYLEMARALRDDLQVTLAVPGEGSVSLPGVQIESYRDEQPESLRRLVQAHQVSLISGPTLTKFPFLEGMDARLVVDLYDPFLLENLHYYLHEPLDQQVHLNTQAVELTNRLARRGDFFICGSERQRDFWTGVLAANGRLNPHTFTQDPALRALIDVVGIGIPDRPPQPAPMLRGLHPAVPAEARLVLWGGGVWDWLDPLTLVQAWPQVLAQHPEARLVFLGTRHPNPLVPQHAKAAETEALAEQIGEKGRTILFFEWLPYEQREALLCEADVGVTLHPLHVETRYAIRTRVLDYIWAKLPVLASSGDVASEWVQEYGLGRVVPPLDVEAVARALNEMLAQPKEAWAAAFEAVQAPLAWSRVVAPLRRYCLQGQAAPDRRLPRHSPGQIGARPSWRGRLARARYILRTQGARMLVHRAWRYARWRLSQPR